MCFVNCLLVSWHCWSAACWALAPKLGWQRKCVPASAAHVHCKLTQRPHIQLDGMLQLFIVYVRMGPAPRRLTQQPLAKLQGSSMKGSRVSMGAHPHGYTLAMARRAGTAAATTMGDGGEYAVVSRRARLPLREAGEPAAPSSRLSPAALGRLGWLGTPAAQTSGACKGLHVFACGGTQADHCTPIKQESKAAMLARRSSKLAR